MMSKKNRNFGNISTGISVQFLGLKTILLLAVLFALQINSAHGEVDADYCVGKPYGWKYQDPLDCHGYFICLQGKAYQTYCDHFEKFDETTRECVVGKCPPCSSCGTDCSKSTASTTASTTTSTTTVTPSTPGDCEYDAWRDPYDCAKYYIITGDVITEYRCTEGLWFNTLTHECDYSGNVQCSSGDGPSTPPTTTPTTAPPSLPCTCGEKWSNPKDCSQYYICFGGVIQLRKCSDGLKFNPQTKNCDFSQNVICDTTPTPTPTPTPAPTPTGISTGTATPTAKPTPTAGPPNPVGSCDGHLHGDIWRNPDNCIQFYVCSWSVITLHTCPAGLQFNSIKRICDYSENVDCDSSNKNDGSCSGRSDGEIWEHPYDCEQYLICKNGKITLHKCAAGFLFNNQIKSCDYSRNVQCGQITPSPATPSPATPSSATPSPATPSTITPAASCFGRPHGDIWAYANDCQQYFVCLNGLITLRKCNTGLLFNKQTRECDYSRNVECGTTPSPATPSPATPSPTTPSTITPARSCFGRPHGDIWAYAYDCQQYFVCLNGLITLRKCNTGLLFNKKTRACDYSRNVECDMTPLPATPAPATPSPVTPSPATPSPETPTRSCSGRPHGDIWAYEYDCQQYFVCSNGVITLRKCNTGLLFNKQTRSCDYSRNVECDTAPSPATPSPATPSTITPARSCFGRPHGDIWAYANDCQQYFVCLNGLITLRKCNTGLLFNKQTKKCDDSRNVECDQDCKGKNDQYAYSNPTDCASYFICRGGLKLPGKCKSGYYFDATIMGCLPQDRVQCNNGGVTQSPSTPTPDPKPPCSTCYNPCQGEKGYVLYREPTNCAKVVICKAGSPIGYECPAGEFFDLTIGACAKASTVACVAIPISPVTKPPLTICDGQKANTIIRDPTNCAKYTICNRGTFECVAGKYFDLKISACRTSSLVDCYVNPTVGDVVTPSEVSPTPAPAPFNPCDALTGYALFRDPANCARVFIFQNGVLTPYECSSGKYFDLKTSSCMQSNLVDCNANMISASTPSSSQAKPSTAISTGTPLVTTPSTTTTTKTVNDGQVDLSIKDCLGKPNGTRFRSLTHCRVFYTCRNKQAVKSSCPLGQWFNDQAFVCDFTYMVGCPAKLD